MVNQDNQAGIVLHMPHPESVSVIMVISAARHYQRIWFCAFDYTGGMQRCPEPGCMPMWVINRDE